MISKLFAPRFIVFAFAVVLTILFYQQSIGLNLVIAEVLFSLYLFKTKALKLQKDWKTLFFIGFISTSLFTILIYTSLVYVVHVVFLLCFIGSLALPKTNFIPYALANYFYSTFKSFKLFLHDVFKNKTGVSKNIRSIKRLALFAIPMAIIAIFIALYRGANPKLDALFTRLSDRLNALFQWDFINIDFGLLFAFILFIFISVFVLYRTASPALLQHMHLSTNHLVRKRYKGQRFQTTGLKQEYRMAVFLFMGLNALLLLVNIIDINWVWFGFEWNGQYLKQFVHEGTYMLIFSILLSFALVLFYFRRNINFLKDNDLLKKLSYAWLIQNAILCISVTIRNFHYIHYFGLAYKRIAVVVFLALVLVALLTVFIKVIHLKSMHYLLRINTAALYFALFFCALIPWDRFIIQYNFNHADTAFVHLKFLAGRSDKSIPLLIKTDKEIQAIYESNLTKVEPQSYYLTPSEYYTSLNSKIERFEAKWERKNLRSWNLPEWLVYKQLANK